MKNRINSFFPSLPLFITILSLSIAQVATAQIPSNGLVGYWNFSGNLNDASSNGNNGMMQTGNNGSINFVTDRFGNANSAIEFVSNPAWNSLGPYVEIPNSQNLLVNSDFTITYSVKVSPQNVIGEIINKGADNISNVYIARVANGILQNGITTSGAFNYSSFPTGSWQTITISYSNSILSFYLNGIIQPSVLSGPILSSSSNYYFGAMVSGSSNGSFYPFQGVIDDISFYNRALTPSEITQLYTDQTSTVVTLPCPTLASNLQTGLVGYWPFCGNANDESGNGNNGTVNGAVASLCPDRNGNINSAYNFQNALGGITVNSFDFPDENYTVSAWVNVTFDPAAISSKNIISHDWNNGGELILFLNEPTSQSVNFDCKPNTGNALPAPVNSNEWNHFVLQRQGLIFRLYLNGVLIQEGIKSSAPLIPNNNLFFGGDPVGTQFSLFNGKLDDICIWNRVLTPTEITQLYTDPSVTPPVACAPFLDEDETVCAGTSVTLSASGSSLACPTLPSNLQTGLVGYWPFCGNANDVSGNGNNGTVNGATLTADRFGNANSAYSFDGVNDRISISHNQALSPSIVTVSLWFNASTFLNTDGNQSQLVSKREYSGWGSAYELGIGKMPPEYLNSSTNTLYTNYTISNNNYTNHYSSSSLTVNDWHQAAYSHDGQYVKFYIDGILVYETPSNGVLSDPGQLPLWFGGRPGGIGRSFYNGLLDEIAIYNRVLTASEIQQLYTLGQSTYLWSTGATTASINVTPTQTTTYTCTVTDANGNACTDSVTVFVPQIEATDLTICAGETTTLSVSGINSTATPSACPTLPSNLQTGLVGYWPFCGNANDESGNGNNGTVEGAALTTDRFGNANSAYSFDGLDDLISCSPGLPIGSSPRTLVSWFKTNAGSIPTSQYPDLQQIAGWGNPYGGPVIFNQWVKAPSGQGYFESGSGGNQVYSLNAVNDNQWHQFVTTYGGPDSKVKIYIDGVAQDSSSNITLTTASSYLGIGNCPFANTPFQGFIDDVCVWDRALSLAEIQLLSSQVQPTYAWSPGGFTTPNINVSPTTTTTYTCTVTTNGVSCTDSITVFVNNPTIDLGSDVTVCGTSTTLIAPTGYDSYVWSNGGTTNTTTVNANGTYTCTVTQGGCSASDAVDVTLVDATISATDSIICAGEIITLSVPQGGSSNTACAALPTNLQNGLVGYWPFCGNANDASGNGNNGTVNGATLTTDRFGNANSAYHFTGVNCCGTPDPTSEIAISNSFINLGGNYTINCWMSSDDVQKYQQCLFNSINHTGFAVELNNEHVPSRLTFGVGPSNAFWDFLYAPGSNTTYTNNQWYNVSFVKEGIVYRMYLNGILDYTGTVGNAINYNQFVGLRIGSIGGGHENFKGTLDDYAVWNRALSPTEIQDLFNATPTSSNSGILWSNGATTPSIDVSPTSTTTYTCTTTINGVSCTDSITVVVNDPTIDLGNDITACGTSTILTASTGYDSYTWSNGGTTNTTTVSANGTYTCTVTQGGCSASDAVDVTLIDATISATDSIICAGETTTLSVPQGGTSSTACAVLPTNLQNGLVGYWPFCGNANDASGNGNTLNEYFVSYDEDRFGNSNSSFFSNGIELGGGSSMTSNNPVFNIGQAEYTIGLWMKVANTSQVTRCLFNTIPHTGLGIAYNDNNAPGYVVYDVGPANAFWTNLYLHGPSNNYTPNDWHYVVVKKQGINYSQYIDGQLDHSYSNPAAANYNYDVNFRISGISPEYQIFHGNIDDVHIYNRALSAAEIVQHYNLTEGDFSSVSYLWSTGATTPTINVSPTTTTTYTCTVTTNGVSCTDTITVVVGNPIASITPNGIVEICEGESISLTGNGGVSYLWNTGAPTQSITVNTEGVYTVTATDEYGCTDSESQLVKVNFLPNIEVNNATICPGQSATLTATGGVSYVWSPATGLSATTGSTVTATPATSTLYTVTGTSANGCTNTATAAVTVNALPAATITPATATTFCQGGSVVLNANTGTGLSYQWYNNASAITGATGASYTATMNGSYTVVVTNASTCSSTSTAVVVTVNALPTATITPASATTFCQGGSVVLNANTGTGLTYQWRLNGNPISGATSSSYTANASGSYTVVVTNSSTCSSTSTAVVVTVNALPTATITPATATTFCQGGSVVLNANTGTGLTYQWFNNSSAISGATAASYTATTSGSYTVVVTNASTCSTTSTAVVVTVNALPTATITPATATTFCQGGSVVLNANTGTGLSYQWRLNGNPISGATSSSYTANASGSYTVVVTNVSLCSSTSAAVVVTTIANVDYFADNDGDGFGDAGTLLSTCVQPQGYVSDSTDCDDNDATVNTAATEVCNHIDDDCSGTIDDGLVFNTYYADNDGDNFGDANNSIDECSQPSGYVTNNTDCNDNNANQNAASPEICNGEDDDCDGAIDNGLIFLDYYADLDSDGFGAGAATNSCVDLGAGYVTNNTDCNNANASINPNATELCNSIDDNCDGQIDEGITFTTYYQDFDNDGFGTGDAVTSCTDLGAGWVTNNTDCDDTNANVNTAVEEICNDIDDNCNNEIDEGLLVVYYLDNDGDSFGSVAVSILACTQPAGYTTDFTDCNDNDANINPSAEDIAGNGIDENCDGQIDNSIFELNASINLYPNPTRSVLNIQISNALVGKDMYIFDAVGKLVYKQQLLSTQTTLSISEYADGNYIFRVGEVVKRFEVMK